MDKGLSLTVVSAHGTSSETTENMGEAPTKHSTDNVVEDQTMPVQKHLPSPSKKRILQQRSHPENEEGHPRNQVMPLHFQCHRPN